jgi:hypothetical protein
MRCSQERLKTMVKGQKMKKLRAIVKKPRKKNLLQKQLIIRVKGIK